MSSFIRITVGRDFSDTIQVSCFKFRMRAGIDVAAIYASAILKVVRFTVYILLRVPIVDHAADRAFLVYFLGIIACVTYFINVTHTTLQYIRMRI